MPNTQAVCTSYKVEALNGIHAFGTTVTRGSTAADTFKAALYLSSATVNATTTAYSATGEVTGTGYTAGGINVTNGTAPTSSGTTAFWTPSASLAYTTVTIGPTDCVLIYNSTQANRAVAAYTFSAQTVTAGTLTLTMPTNDATNALLRLA
jgi:hypothetical protein